MTDYLPDPTNVIEPDKIEIHKQERVQKGYSWFDWINFDTYIAWVIANAVQDMKDHGTTAFSFEDEPKSDWGRLTHEEYDKMIKGFGAWSKGSWNFDRNELERMNKDLNEALDIFHKRFKSLWD